MFYAISTTLVIVAGMNIGCFIYQLRLGNLSPISIGTLNLIAGLFCLWVFYFRYHKLKDKLIKE